MDMRFLGLQDSAAQQDIQARQGFVGVSRETQAPAVPKCSSAEPAIEMLWLDEVQSRVERPLCKCASRLLLPKRMLHAA
jgi:hypothetical protein